VAGVADGTDVTDGTDGTGGPDASATDVGPEPSSE
jgi:hypothetical protein